MTGEVKGGREMGRSLCLKGSTPSDGRDGREYLPSRGPLHPPLHFQQSLVKYFQHLALQGLKAKYLPHVENIISRLGKKFSLPRAQKFSRMPVLTHDSSVKIFLVIALIQQ